MIKVRGSGQRRAVGWLAASTLVLASGPLLGVAGAAAPGTITLVGTGDRAVVVRLISRVTLDVPRLDTMGGPAFGHLTRTPYFGFAVARVDDGHVVAGRVRSTYIERTLGLAADISLGPGGAVLEPGTYRFTLIGRGPLKLLVRTKDLRTSVTWKVSRAAKVRFEAGPLAAAAGRPLVEHRSAVTIAPSTFLSYGSVYRQGSLGISATSTCLTRDGAPTCAGGDPGPLGSSSQGLGGAGGASGVNVQPGDKVRGEYLVLHQAPTPLDGAQYGYDLLVLG